MCVKDIQSAASDNNKFIQRAFRSTWSGKLRESWGPIYSSKYEIIINKYKLEV